jgi:hypothetical protein
LRKISFIPEGTLAVHGWHQVDLRQTKLCASLNKKSKCKRV